MIHSVSQLTAVAWESCQIVVHGRLMTSVHRSPVYTNSVFRLLNGTSFQGRVIQPVVATHFFCSALCHPAALL